MDPVPPPNLDAGATPLLEGSVVGGEVRAKYFQEFSKYLNVADYEGILFEVELVAQGAGEGPAGSTTGDPVVATSSVQGGNVPPPAMVRGFDHLSLPASIGRVALSFNVRRPVVPPW